MRPIGLLIALAMMCLPGAHGEAGDLLVQPYVQNVTPTAATILWESKETNAGTVHYGPGEALGFEARETQARDLHRVRLEDLKAGTRYHYGVPVGTRTYRGTFKTAPLGRAPVTFVVVGGTRNWGNAWADSGMADHAAQWDPDFFLHTGNLTADGSDQAQWREHLARFATSLALAPMIPARGASDGLRSINTTSIAVPKDIADRDEARRRAMADLQRRRELAANHRDYFSIYHDLPGTDTSLTSFDWGATHVVLIDVDRVRGAAEPLDAHLKQASRANLVVVQYPPIYASGMHNPQVRGHAAGDADMAPLTQVLERNQVLLHLSGGGQTFERSQPLRDGKRARGGVTYVVQGGETPSTFPEHFTAASAWQLRNGGPAYTVVHLEQDGGWTRSYALDRDGAIREVDDHAFWRGEAQPKAALARVLEAGESPSVQDVEALGYLAYGPALDALVPFLKHDDAALRRAAARALRAIGKPAATPGLIESLGDPDPQVRHEAARALEIAMDPAQARELVPVVLDPARDKMVRVCLMGALEQAAPFYQTVDAADLILHQPDAPPVLRERAAHAIARVATRDDIDALRALVVREEDRFPLLRLSLALNQLCAADVDLRAVAAATPGPARMKFAGTWGKAYEDLLFSEQQADKREALEGDLTRRRARGAI